MHFVVRFEISGRTPVAVGGVEPAHVVQKVGAADRVFDYSGFLSALRVVVCRKRFRHTYFGTHFAGVFAKTHTRESEIYFVHPVGSGVARVPDVVKSVQIVVVCRSRGIEIDVGAARRVGLSGNKIYVYLLVFTHGSRRLVRLDKLLVIRRVEVGNSEVYCKTCRYAHSAFVGDIFQHILSDVHVVYEEPIMRSVAHDAQPHRRRIVINTEILEICNDERIERRPVVGNIRCDNALSRNRDLELLVAFSRQVSGTVSHQKSSEVAADIYLVVGIKRAFHIVFRTRKLMLERIGIIGYADGVASSVHKRPVRTGRRGGRSVVERIICGLRSARIGNGDGTA